VYAGKRFVNAYIGHGIPYEKSTYTLPMPPSIQSEWAPAGEDEDAAGSIALVEQADVKVDPTPPKPEGEEAEEE
jgi:hypothetical protein